MADDTDPKLVYNLVMGYWDYVGVGSPACYVSIIGGNDKAILSEEVKDSLKDMARETVSEFELISLTLFAKTA